MCRPPTWRCATAKTQKPRSTSCAGSTASGSMSNGGGRRGVPCGTPAESGRFGGYAGPANRKAAEVISKYIISDMYAKAVQGTSPEDAVQWAHAELVKIY